MHQFIDEKGRTWHEFTCSYKHPIDEQAFAFTVWAIDFADAQERLRYIGELGKVDGKLESIIDY